VPEVVIRELQRQQHRAVAGKVDYLQKAQGKLPEAMAFLGLDPLDHPVALPDFTGLAASTILDDLFDRVRERLEANLVEILPIPMVSHKVLLSRDLAGRLPFGPSGKGYRDALIWHTIVERWASTQLFEDAYIVTNDDDFGKGDLDATLAAELPVGSTPVKVPDIASLLTISTISSLHDRLQTELEDAALRREDLVLERELASEGVSTAIHDAARDAVHSTIDGLYDVSLSYAQQAALHVGREFGDLTLSSAAAMGDFEWTLYDQLDGDTLLGQGSMTAEIGLSAHVDKQDAAVLADPDIHVEAWDYDAAQVSFYRNARLTFDLRVDIGGAGVEDVSLSAVDGAD
jgi:hypothetical protein